MLGIRVLSHALSAGDGREANWCAARAILSLGRAPDVSAVIRRGDVYDGVYFARPLSAGRIVRPDRRGRTCRRELMGYRGRTNTEDYAAMAARNHPRPLMASFMSRSLVASERRLTHNEINSRFRELRAYSHFEEAQTPPF